MRLVLLALCIATGSAAACPLAAEGEAPRPCNKLLKDRYITSTVYLRAVHAPPPAFDQAKTTKFLTAARWTPVNVDLDRASYAIVDRKGKESAGQPSLRFVDASTVTTSPKSTKRLQIVLVRQVDEVDGDTIVSVDGEDYALVPCRRGKRVSACLIAPAETRRAWEKRKRDLYNGKL